MATTRAARPSDAVGIAAVHVQSWRATYPGLLPDPYLLGLSVQDQARRWEHLLKSVGECEAVFVLADEDRHVAGYGVCGPQRTQLPGFDGEFYALYLVDRLQGQGHGRRMMGVMASALAAREMTSACVWVLGDNPARWFYQRLGGQHLAERRTEFAGRALTEWAYGWRDLAELARLSADPALG